MNTIKCGRKIIELTHGSIIMDNGHCRQLLRKHPSPSLLVSKVAFETFKKMREVSEIKNHSYDVSVSLWQYRKET